MMDHPAVERLSKRPGGAEKLAASIETAKNSTFFYKRLFRKHFREPVSPADVLDRFVQLPFTSKEDVVRNYPDGFLGVPMRDVALYCESTGTLGNTLGSTKGASFYTEADLTLDAERRFSADLQIVPDDIVVNALPFALTSSGVCFHMAARQKGATVINLDSGSLLSSPTKHIEIIADLKATVLICSLPTLYSTLLSTEGEAAKDKFSALRAVQLCGLATLSNGKKKIAQLFGVPVFDTYGLSEFGATTFTCTNGHMHVFEEHFVIEIIDPRSGSNVGDGIGGEIVITTLTRQGSPKIRYRTADFGIMEYAPCACGRHEPRLTVKGRLRDAAQFGERFRLPIDFEEIIHRFPETTGLYRLIYAPLDQAAEAASDGGGIVSARIVVDVTEPREDLKQKMESALRFEIGSHITVELTATGGATPELLSQKMYSSVRTVKSAVFDDRRPTEWLVTY
jgi:phenylacetate-CoA ligase